MGGGLESCCVGRVYDADGAARHHPHRIHDLHSSSQDHHPSKNSEQKTICYNSTSNAPDDGRMYPKHVELRIHKKNYLVASGWHFAIFHFGELIVKKTEIHICRLSHSASFTSGHVAQTVTWSEPNRSASVFALSAIRCVSLAR